jgi:hypothetical protein
MPAWTVPVLVIDPPKNPEALTDLVPLGHAANHVARPHCAAVEASGSSQRDGSFARVLADIFFLTLL